jgi:hypothetical protein
MGDFQDLTGCQFGELTVVRLYRKCANGGSTWHCRCSCGREVDLPASDLLKGRLTCGACNYGHYCFYPGYAECLLPNGNSFLIDIQDYPVVSRYRWVKTREGYFSASCGKRNSHITLHRLIMNPPAGTLVDHIDGNKNNCRRRNMRLTDYAGNARNIQTQKNNKCGLKGVYWASDRNKWRAEITADGRHIHIGSFDTREAAARAYDKYALSCFGEFAKTNEMMGNFTDRELTG